MALRYGYTLGAGLPLVMVWEKFATIFDQFWLSPDVFRGPSPLTPSGAKLQYQSVGERAVTPREREQDLVNPIVTLRVSTDVADKLNLRLVCPWEVFYVGASVRSQTMFSGVTHVLQCVRSVSRTTNQRQARRYSGC